ncbi:transglycosylase SLT domain-containing protein [Neptuniibacter sp. PT34_22]|uniref:transglycosylase SLT domain-containing protein n=1 Tax=Neptuniibacter sp. PT34_22 TaxID=3398205 RepID=UPI0039F4954E
MKPFWQTTTGVFTLTSLLITAPLSHASIEQQRKQFLQAETYLKQNKSQSFKKARKALADYPLAPYLDYQYELKRLYKSNSANISVFIKKYPELPIADRLNRTWLNHLARNSKWETYRKHYRNHPITSVHYQCQQQTALLNGNSKQKEAALYQAPKLWMVSNSQPTTCDPLFKAWMTTGRPTSNEASQRFWMSVEQNEIKLARYLTKKIKDKKQKQQAELFWKLYNSPELVNGSTLNKIDKAQRPIAAAIAYKRWYRKQPITATQTWIKKRDGLMPQVDQDKVSLYMGERLNWTYHSQAIKLSKQLDPEYRIEELTERRIRNALAKQDWKTVLEATNHLNEEEKKDSKWQYWSLIAERHLKPETDQKEKIAEVAKDRSFYGFLAAELNQSPFQLNAKSDAVTQEQLDELAKLPAAARAGELFKLGRLTEANREWRLALSQMDEQQKNLAGYLANSWGWHLQAIINAAKTERWDHIDLRFPYPHAKLFKEHALKNDLDLSFPVAIARQESAFLFNATSRVGARGLMQLMPQTAKLTAKKHEVPYKKNAELDKPEINITLGSAYLGDMLKKFDNNPAYAAAAYNAGPHRVTKWLKQRGDLPLDIWIETIPFKETRKYVQSVLAFRVIYDRLEGRQASLLNDKQIAMLAVNQSKKTAL